MESLKLTATNKPLGTLADYRLRSTATPFDPTDSSGQVPTFTAKLTDVEIDPKTLGGTKVTLTDFTGLKSFANENGEAIRGEVVSVDSSPTSGIVALDNATLFDKLNTEQTTMPITILDTPYTSGEVAIEALTHWCLMAGVPEYSIEGNLRDYVSKWATYGYMANSKYKWRFFGPATAYTSWVTSEGSLGGNSNPIEVNPAQTITIGMRALSELQVQEYRVQAYLPHIQDNAIYTIRRVNNSWYVLEKNGSNATTTLHSFVHTLTTVDPAYMMVQFRANAASDKVDITTRIIEYNAFTKQTLYSDYSVNGVTSTMRNRPQPFKMDLGYDPSVIGSLTFGAPEVGFITESATLQENYPTWQVTGNSISSADVPTALAQIKKLPEYVPGFTGNVWDKIREFCSIIDFDVYFRNNKIDFQPREKLRRDYNTDAFIPAEPMAVAGVREKVSKREQARSVEVIWYERLPGSDNLELMYKADSVLTLEKGEKKVEVVKTNNSFSFLNQPVPVSGVPVPYTSAFGSYVVTGADGYIIDPQWWKDNGGSIKVNTTGVSGEIEITMQAPTIDTVRAPYRISEGEADRPALYIMGFGIAFKEPQTIKIMTGNSKASQDVGATLNSPFLTKSIMAMNAGARLAEIYGTSEVEIGFSIDRDSYTGPRDNIQPPTPLNNSLYWDGSYYRIASQEVGPRGIQLSDCRTYNTIGTVNGEFSESKTIADWNALHGDKTIAEVNIAPLPKFEG